MANGVLIEKKPNPAKERLSGYRAILHRRDELREEIEESFGRATSCSVRLKPVTVSGSAASYDRIADDVLKGVDARVRLEDKERELSEKLDEILALIDLVTDERQKTVLTLRYVRGKPWDKIAEEIHCEKRHVFRLHGLALVEINKKM